MTQSTFRLSLRVSRTLIGATLATLAALTMITLTTGTLHAQSKAPNKKSSDKTANALKVPPIVGTWSGTATVPLKDSSIVVPVIYTFTQNGATIGGTAMVPGQGTGPISDVVSTGSRLTFRVTAPEGKVLEHDGTFAPDGAIEGMVNFENKPVAKFRITPKKATAPAQ
ncbi:MAG: hypothetical protein ABIT38_02590 [Gemmatimonadaceae bacterium]